MTEIVRRENETAPDISNPLTDCAEGENFASFNIKNVINDSNVNNAVEYNDEEDLSKAISQAIAENNFYNCSSNVLSNPNIYTLTQTSLKGRRYPTLTDKNFFVSFFTDKANTQTSIKIALAGWNSATSVDALSFGDSAFAVGDLPINTFCKFMFDQNQQKFILIYKGQKSGNSVGDVKESYQTTNHGQIGSLFQWLLLDGSTFNATNYPALAVLFPSGALPDHRGRTSVGAGQGAGLNNKTLGSTFGSETKTINVNNLPSFNIPIGGGAYTDDYNNQASGRATTNFTRWNTNLTFTGQNLPLNVEQPSIAVNKFIYTGI